MALTDENNMVMPVAPMYGGGNGFGNGFGGDGWWILLLFILLGNGGWGNGFGMGGFNNQLGTDFPWLMNGQNGINANTNTGFQNAMLNDGITSIRDGISGLSTQLCGCCGDMQMGMATGFAGVQQSLCSGFAGVEQGANARQLASMQQAFAAQEAVNQGFNSTQAAVNQGFNSTQASVNQGFNSTQAAMLGGFNQVGAQLASASSDNRLGLADLKYTVATENCADRTAAMQNTRDIIDSQTRGTQAILDKLCALELDGLKSQIDAKNDIIAQLRQENIYARGQASQDAQTAAIWANQSTVANQLMAEMRSCPIPAQPVYGNQPIFTCGGNVGCGCGVG